MARVIGPDQQYRVFYQTTGPNAGKALAPPGTPVPLYADAQASVPADVLGLDGSTIAGTPPTVLIGSTYEVPQFQYPDGVKVVYTRVLGGPVQALYALADDRLDQLEAEDTELNALVAATAVILPAATGTDDTTAINTLLAASAGKVVRGRPGSTYLISDPLVVRSGTTLDMTGCTIRLLSGSDCNMLQNYAVGQVRRVLDAVTTASSATLTSATAAFTSADVGKAITIQGAGAAGVPLTTTISAFTNATTVTLGTTAGTSTTGQYAAIGARDSDIAIVGGTWDRDDNGSAPVDHTFDAHSLRLRHVDRLTIRDLTCVSDHGADGKYQINPGDCTNITIRDIKLPLVGSDGVHFNGPCRGVIVNNIQGDSLADDLVSFTARDTFAIITDCAGDIEDVVVDTVSYRTSLLTTSSAVKLVAGQNTTQTSNYYIRNFKIRNVTGPSQQGVIRAGDIVPVGGNGGRFEDILIESVKSVGTGDKPTIYLLVGLMDRITIRDATSDSAADSAVVMVSATVGRLVIEDIHWTAATATTMAYINAGTVDTLIIRGVQASVVTGALLVKMESTGSTVGRLYLSQIDLSSATTGGGMIEYITSAASIGKVHISDVTTHNVAYPLGAYRSNTTVHASNVHATGMTSWLRARDAAVVTVAGASGMVGDVDFVTVDASAEVLYRAPVSNVIEAGWNALSSGEEALDRLLSTGEVTLTSGLLVLTYFTARKTESIPNVVTITRSVAATSTTLARVGIYQVAKNGDLTLVASLANDTTLWNSTFGRFNKALSSAFSKVAGRRYAIGVLWVGGGTAPRLSGCSPVSGFEAQRAPAINGSLTGQTDLPSSIPVGSIGNSAGASVYAAMI